MTLSLSTDLRTAQLIATAAFIDQGTGSGRLSVYAGARPINGAVPGAAPLVELTLAEPCGTAVAGTLALVTGIEALIDTSGIATWARLVNGSGVTVFDADVSDAAGTGDIKLPTTQLYAGGTTRLVSGILR